MLEIFLLTLVIMISFIVLLTNRRKKAAVFHQEAYSSLFKRHILITGENYSLEFPVILSNNSSASIIKKSLPMTGKINKWSEGIYFSTNITIPRSNDRSSDIVVGDVAYWPENKAICIFYDTRPTAENEGSKAESSVIKIGHTSAKPELLKKIAIGDKIEIL
ncbi:MAG: cyclophilin-like fold protein [Candidatus Omnitrophica bacterium]|nr:cyclophilin-like fold protein [Candidatus Omnitrophota bacterium]